MSYHIETTKSAEKQLASFSQDLQERIFSKVFLLKDNPRIFGSKKLHGSEYYRIRIGDYRVVYSINDVKKRIIILDVGHRKDIYR